MPSYVGNMWSSLTEIGSRGQMNIVGNEVAIAEGIVAFLLTRWGEDPFNPDYGLDFNLFENFNEFDADAWGYYIQDKLFKYIAGISGVNVRVTTDPIEGRAQININYATDRSSSVRTLTFPYHVYTGLQNGDAAIEDFIESISLNNNRFTGLR